MAEPLLGRDPLVGHCDPIGGLATARGWVAGPAGSAGLDLGDGMSVDVDVAEPSVLVELAIELPLGVDPAGLSRRQRRGLQALLGDDRAGVLADIVRDAGDGIQPARSLDGGPTGHRPRTVDDTVDAADTGDLDEQARSLDGGPAGDRPRRVDGASPGRRRGRAPGVAPALHRTALARTAAGVTAARPLVQAVGLIEAAVLFAPVGAALWAGASRSAGPPGADVRRDLGLGVDLLLDVVADGQLVVPGQRAAHELAALLRQATKFFDGSALATARLLALARDLDRGDHVRADDQGWAPAVAFAAAAPAGPPELVRARAGARDGGRPVLVDTASLPGPLAEVPLAAGHRSPAEVLVRAPGLADRSAGLWARAFRAADDCLVAVAPFRAHGADAEARMLVPPDVAGGLEVDVTDRPEMPRSSPSLGRVQRAIHAGRSAARAERLGSLDDAAIRWQRCARDWQAAGDETRAQQAGARSERLRGDRSVSAQPIAPLVTDLVDPEP